MPFASAISNAAIAQQKSSLNHFLQLHCTKLNGVVDVLDLNGDFFAVFFVKPISPFTPRFNECVKLSLEVFVHAQKGTSVSSTTFGASFGLSV